jgi:hypothetical protein
MDGLEGRELQEEFEILSRLCSESLHYHFVGDEDADHATNQKRVSWFYRHPSHCLQKSVLLYIRGFTKTRNQKSAQAQAAQPIQKI